MGASYTAGWAMGDVCWLITCSRGAVPEDQTYATESAADAVIGLHAGACPGDHTVEPVAWIEDGEGRVRLAAAHRPSSPTLDNPERPSA
jgi:hypothetical protein